MKESTTVEMGICRKFYKLLPNPGAAIGPLIDMNAVEKVEAHIADAVKNGAKASALPRAAVSSSRRY
jgi:acyl-CoA reductase-like NAD-dependent aldehyde dehydrogenase